MVERVSTGPQLGGQNLADLVAQRSSQQNLLRSVSGPPAAASVPSPAPPDPEPVEAPETNERAEAFERARNSQQQVQNLPPQVQRAAQVTNTTTQLRELIGDAIDNLDTGGPNPALEQIPAAGVSNAQQASAPPVQTAAQVGGPEARVEANTELVGGGEPAAPPVTGLGQSNSEGPRPEAVARATAPIPQVRGPELGAPAAPPAQPAQTAQVPEVQSPSQTAPAVQVPDTPEAEQNTQTAEPPGARGEVVDVVA